VVEQVIEEKKELGYKVLEICPVEGVRGKMNDSREWLQDGAPLVEPTGRVAVRGEVEVQTIRGSVGWIGNHAGHSVEITTYSAISGSYAVKVECGCGAVAWVAKMEKPSEAPAIPAGIQMDLQLKYMAIWHLGLPGAWPDNQGRLLQALVALVESERCILSDRWYKDLENRHPPGIKEIREIRGHYQLRLLTLQDENDRQVIHEVMELLHEIDPCMYKWCALIESEREGDR
jgi:hypothetical protein